MIIPRAVYDTAPPERRTRLQNNATLLYSWWCTIFSLTIIGFRLAGRYIRNNELYTEDKIMAYSIIPLMARMAFIHVVLIYGTNNVNVSGLTDETLIHHREIGSRLVLAARIFYALFIWMAKFTVSEFLKRLTQHYWKKGYELGLRGIRIFLAATFVAVVIATLAECQPFDHYYQVIPDPGPKCRQGYGHLFTMGICDIITDIVLICFPIPIILRSGLPLKRKLSLTALFSMSIILIGITGSRVPLVVRKHGLQQYRTVFASSEILAAASVSNAIILGSFLRDRGLKKAKYKFGSATDSMDRKSSTRRPTLQALGSDEELARELGYRTKPEPGEERQIAARPAPMADLSLLTPSDPGASFSSPDWQSSSRQSKPGALDISARAPDDPLPTPRSGRRVSFIDAGGLLEPESRPSTNAPSPSPTDSIVAQDFAPQTNGRRGSRASNNFPNGRAFPPPTRRSSRLSQQSEEYEMSVRPGLQLNDPSGLLSEQDEITVEEKRDTSLQEFLKASAVNHTSESTCPQSPAQITRSHTETSYGTTPSLQDAGGLLSTSPSKRA